MKTQAFRNLKLFLLLVFSLTNTGLSFSQSLIGNSAIKNFEEISLSETNLLVGNNTCATSITSVKVAKNGLLVTMNKPKNCKFKYLELTVGQEVFPLAGLGEEFEPSGENYKWRSNFQNGSLFFVKNENQTIPQLNSMRIREPFCNDGSCLSSAMILVASTPANVVTPGQVAINASIDPAAPTSQQANVPVVPVNNTIAPLLAMCVDNNDGTFTGADGAIWQKCVVGQSWLNGRCVGERKTVNWYEATIEAKYDRFLGNKDWVIPTEQLIRKTLIDESCNHHDVIKRRDSESVKGYWWTSTPAKKLGQAEIMSENTGGGTAYIDHHVSTKNDWNAKPTGIGVTLVRKVPSGDFATIQNSFKQAELEISKRLQQPK